jgi:hypothetical protein
LELLMRAILLATALVTFAALPAAAQSVKVSFKGGKVDLIAENATVRAILTEWGRVGGTRLVNADRVAGPPITVEFKDTYEQQVLESLLRGVAGYMVGQRGTDAPTSSGFDRIVILASSNAPRPAPVTPAVSRPPGPQPIRRLPVPVEENQDNDPDIDPNANVNGNPNPAPRPETPADLRRRLGQLLDADADDDRNQQPPAPATTPSNPFGITTGAARPGVITPAPQPRQTTPRQAPDPSTQP